MASLLFLTNPLLGCLPLVFERFRSNTVLRRRYGAESGFLVFTLRVPGGEKETENRPLSPLIVHEAWAI